MAWVWSVSVAAFGLSALLLVLMLLQAHRGAHKHDWGKWSAVERDTAPYYDAETLPYDFQRRTCSTCGQTDEREVASE